jgi:uncharacterized protein (DUF2235 family)
VALFPQVDRIYLPHRSRKPIFRGQNVDAAQQGVRELFPDGERNGQNKRLLDAIDNSRRTSIHFIGVWDTVGSLGVPYGPLRWVAVSRYNFHNTDLSENVNYAYHALAIDERRGPFKPTLWTRAAGRGALPEDQAHRQILEQVWFVGCHSNVGGGYVDSGLSDISFLWMVSKAAAAAQDTGTPLAFDEEYLNKKLDHGMGQLVDSAAGKWRLLPQYVRQIMASAPRGKETCQFIHWSVVQRYKSSTDGKFKPFPYRPKNARALLEGLDPSIVVQLSEFEKTYRFQEILPSPPTSGG